MRAAVLDAPGAISVQTFPDPTVVKPTDAVVAVVAACVCGSDLWPYRGVSAGRGRMGHEFLGVVVDVGAEVPEIRTGQLVIAPFLWSCGHCVQCRAGWPTSCLVGGGYGAEDRDGIMVDGGQGEFVRVPQADGTLVVANVTPQDSRIPALLSLSDVMCTGYHAALGAGAGPGRTIAVVGDGAVGLCAVLGARHLGAERIVILSTHPDRADLAVRFGATDVVAARGDEASDAVRELTEGVGADGVCECVGTQGSWATAVAACRPGGSIGWVGVPHEVTDGLPLFPMFRPNIGIRGGTAPARRYLPELLPSVLDGSLDPGPVFDLTVPLEDIAAGYAAMDDRRAIKVLVVPSGSV